MKYLLVALLLMLAAGCHKEGAQQIVIWDDQFECTKSHYNDWVQFVQSGEVMVPIFHHDFVCDQYTRIGETP